MSHTGVPGSANPPQRVAITTIDGSLVIIAGLSSGKTFTLVERIVALITDRGVAPEQLMVVTFTDKAAQELTTHITNRLHQLGVRFNLNEKYLDYAAIPNVELLIGDPQRTSPWYRSERLRRWVNTVSEEMLKPGVLGASPDPAIRALDQCATLYRTQLDEANALDFSTIQVEALQLLRTYPAVRDALRTQIPI